MRLLTLSWKCFLILLGSSTGLELKLSLREIVELDGAKKLAKWAPVAWRSPQNLPMLARLLDCPWANLRSLLRPPNDTETFEALKMVATGREYKGIRDRLLSAENVASNLAFLKWAVADRNYIPRDSLASNRVAITDRETFDIISDALLCLPEQRRKGTYFGALYRFLLVEKDPSKFRKCYSRIKDLGGPGLFSMMWDRLRSKSRCVDTVEEFARQMLSIDSTVFTPSRLLFWLACSRISDEKNANYPAYCRLRDLLLEHQAEPEWKVLLEGAQSKNSDLEEMWAAARSLVERRVVGAMTPSNVISLLCIYAPIFRRARSASCSTERYVEERFQKEVGPLIEVGSIPLAQADMELDSIFYCGGLRRALKLGGSLKEFYQGLSEDPDISLYKTLTLIEDPEGQRKAYLRDMVRVFPSERELVSVRDTLLTLDEQAELLLGDDGHTPHVLDSWWLFATPQSLQGGKYAKTAHDLALNYLKVSWVEPGYLWDAKRRIIPREDAIKRWKAFFKALPVLLLRGERLPGIDRLFKKDEFGGYSLVEMEFAREQDDGSSMKDSWESQIQGTFEDTRLGLDSKLIDLMILREDSDYSNGRRSEQSKEGPSEQPKKKSSGRSRRKSSRRSKGKSSGVCSLV